MLCSFATAPALRHAATKLYTLSASWRHGPACAPVRPSIWCRSLGAAPRGQPPTRKGNRDSARWEQTHSRVAQLISFAPSQFLLENRSV